MSTTESTPESTPEATSHWKTDPDEHDFPAARSYLSLLVSPEAARVLVKALQKQKECDTYLAKDILRASGLALLGPDDAEVERDLDKVKSGDKLSPVLLVRGAPLWVADGYHRVCASYHLDPKTPVPCNVVGRMGLK
jgi:hypothetical protein